MRACKADQRASQALFFVGPRLREAQPTKHDFIKDDGIHGTVYPMFTSD